MAISARTFLLATAIFFSGSLTAYVRFVDSIAFPVQPVYQHYPQFLLESAKDIKGKVIFESGSNSRHSVIPSIFSNYFKAPVITVAMNAGYPLPPRVFNLERYTNEGDVIILPLEWGMYLHDNVLPIDFLRAVSAPNSRHAHYYDNLPVFEKIQFLLQQFPVNNVIQSLRTSMHKRQIARRTLNQLNRFQKIVHSGERDSFGAFPNKPTAGDTESDRRATEVRTKSCDNYILYRQIKNGFTISTEFRRALRELKRLTARGANVYFTWPAVVDYKGRPCYQNQQLIPKIENYANEIRSLIEAAGYTFIGEFGHSRFPPECFRDTYYHLTKACALTRSRRLVEQLASAGVTPTNSKTSPEQLLRITDQRIALLKSKVLAELEATLPQATDSISVEKFQSHLLLSGGWSEPKGIGVWSIGHQSVLSLQVPERLHDFDDIQLRIYGTYFNGSEKTSVRINGRNYGKRALTTAKFKIPSDLRENGILRLELEHYNVQSPHELGLSNDRRQLKFRLTELKVEPVIEK